MDIQKRQNKLLLAKELAEVLKEMRKIERAKDSLDTLLFELKKRYNRIVSDLLPTCPFGYFVVCDHQNNNKLCDKCQL